MLGKVHQPHRERVTLLTHGSPLRRLYARYFPEYFDQTLFARVHDSLGRPGSTTWFNLHRRTDFIGGSVFNPALEGTEDLLVLDPETPLPPFSGELPPPIRGHSDYYHQSEYGKILITVLEGVEPAPGSR
jgi:hypothetical protein